MKKTVIFYFLCFLILISFIYSFINAKNLKNYILPVFNTISVNIETKPNLSDDILINVNDTYSSFSVLNDNILHKAIRGNATKIYILVKENYTNYIGNIIIFNDIKSYFFKDFTTFKKDTLALCMNNNCNNYYSYEIPKSIKYNPHFNSYNFRSISNCICVFILGIVSGGANFFISYILLFATIIYFINNKNAIKLPNLNAETIFILIFLSGIVIYSNGIFNYLPFDDEYATLKYAAISKTI